MSRPIDADELIEKIRKLPNAGIKWFVSAEAVFDTILNAPTIKPQSERMRGKWIKRGGTINCSICKHCNWSECFEHTVMNFNFCPNCGADMRGES